MNTRWLIWVLVGTLWLGACTSTPDTPIIQPTFVPGITAQPTFTPPAYRVANTRITADNANQLTYLGRLDNTASAPSTLFSTALSPDGTRLVGVNQDLIIMWDITRGATVFTTGRQDTTRLFYASDKTEVYAVDTVGVVRVLETERGAFQTSFEGDIRFNGSSAFWQDGGWLALGSEDGAVQIWDTYNRTSLAKIQAHAIFVTALAFSPDGERLATAGQDGFVRVWDWRNRAELLKIDLKEAGVLEMTFSPDGRFLTLGTLAYIETHDLETGQLRYSLAVGVDGLQDILRYSPDGTTILTGGNASAPLSVVNAETGEIIAQMASVQGERLGVAFSPDSQLIVTTALDGGASLWNLAQATENTIPEARLLVGSTRLTSVAWSQDGFLLAFFDAGGSVFLWGIP